VSIEEARRAPPARWSLAVIALHWISAALILVLIALGVAMVHGPFGAAQKFDFYQLHKSLGFAALAVMALHLAARLATRAPPPRGALFERRLAALAQAALYALSFAAILAGWLDVSTSPLPIPTRVFNLFVMPNIARPDHALYQAALAAHRYASWLIAALVALHVAGALKHHILDKDDVLKRMAP
jgi:cytochrome b561